MGVFFLVDVLSCFCVSWVSDVGCGVEFKFGLI